MTLATSTAAFTSSVDVAANINSGTGGLSSAVIGGIVGGVLGGVILICVVCILYLVRRQKNIGSQKMPVSEIPEAGGDTNRVARSSVSDTIDPSGRLNYPEAQY